MRKTVAREMVEKNGVDADRLLDLLVRIAVHELSSYYYYTILRVNLIGMEGEVLKKILEDVRREDLNHLEALVPRIHELGGTLPMDVAELGNKQASPITFPADTTDLASLLEALLKAAEYSVRGYTELCNLTCGMDNRTYGLALAILHEEIEHQVWFLEFLGHGKREQTAPEVRGQSPFVSKYLQSGNTLATN
jgi:ferritin-like protein